MRSTSWPRCTGWAYASAAAEAYDTASRYGGLTQPGLALLWLSQGKVEVSAAAIRRALAETAHPLERSRMLPAYVDILLAASDFAAARSGAGERGEIATVYGTTALRARSAYANGAVDLAGDTPDVALPALRRAWQLWCELDVPYEAARARADRAGLPRAA